MANSFDYNPHEQEHHSMSYQPTLESVKTHPMPNWYNDAKFGIFIHWGIYSVPAFAPHGALTAEKMLKGELGFDETPYAEWYQNSLRIQGSSVQKYHAKTYGKAFKYEQFAPMFNEQIQKWNPELVGTTLCQSRRALCGASQQAS
ncbi:MAG: alpha-L-fucosidase [Anaerolineales bacterium]